MGLLSLFGSITEHNPQPPARDFTPNVANRIAAHLEKKWPELRHIPGLWFSGSQVWSHLYGKEPPETSDTDVFVLATAQPVTSYSTLGATQRSPLAELLHKLGLPESAAVPRKPPEDKPHYVPDGCDVKHVRGDFDIWTTKAETVQGQLRSYPRSHSHCRAAFSFFDGLVVLPNEEAT